MPYYTEDVVAVRHGRRRAISPFWLAVLLEDVQVEVHGGKFSRFYDCRGADNHYLRF